MGLRICIISPLSKVTPKMSSTGQFRMSALTPDRAALCTSVKKQKDTDTQ